MSWLGSLQFAAWKGVPFYTEVVEVRAGRNTAVHAYPFRERNPVWVEDLGLGPRSHRITGFLIGDAIAAQQLLLLAAVQSPGQGNLIHPTLGLLTGSIVNGCSFTLRKDRGRYIEVQFEFIENLPDSPYPTAAADTGGGVASAAGNAQGAAAGSFQASTGAGPSALLDRVSLGAVPVFTI